MLLKTVYFTGPDLELPLSRYHSATVAALDVNQTKLGYSPARDRSPLDSGRGSLPPLLHLSILAVVTAAGAVLRFHALAVKTFWFDEALSVGIARLDWYNFVRILWRREANMSLYYLLLRAWLHFGSSEASIQSLSVLFGVAAIPALYLLGRRLFGSPVGLIAAALLCVNSYHLHYCQEARSYSLTMFLCILSSLYFLKLLDVPSRANRDVYVLLSALAFYAHFFSALMLLAHRLSLHFLDSDGVPKQTRRVWVPIAVAVSPGVAFIATTGVGPVSWIPRPGLYDLWQLTLRLTGDGGPLLVFLYAGACLGAVAGNVDWGKKQVSREAWLCRFLLLWMFLPVLLVFAVSMVRPLFVARYFIFSLPALLLLASAGLARIRSRWLFATILLVFLGISLRGTAAYYHELSTSPPEGWRAASQYLLRNTRPGDALVFHIAMGRLPYEFYRSLQSPSAVGPDVLYPYHGSRITFLDFVEKPDYARLRAAIPQHPRVWFVISSADKTASVLSSLISAAEPISERHDFGGIQVVLYSKPAAAPSTRN